MQGGASPSTDGAAGKPLTIANGPLFKQRASVAYREVIRNLNPGYAVHRQCYPNFPNLNSFHYRDGKYFADDAAALGRAMRAFSERVTRQAAYVDTAEGRPPASKAKFPAEGRQASEPKPQCVPRDASDESRWVIYLPEAIGPRLFGVFDSEAAALEWADDEGLQMDLLAICVHRPSDLPEYYK